MITIHLVLLLAMARLTAAPDPPIVTFTDFPEYVVAGTPFKLTFTVGDHGRTLFGGLQPSVRASAPGGLTAKSNAVAAKSTGEYAATLTLPQPGNWTLTIASGFNGTEVPLPPLKVIAPGAPTPAAFSPSVRGVRLFTTKGCVACHRHIEVNPARAADTKLDLTGKRYPQDYLKKFLAGHGAKLKGDEVEALAAFINKLLTKSER
jgi:mono/diheme cytochrome c family protein